MITAKSMLFWPLTATRTAGGVITEIGVSITGDQISTEEKRFTRKGNLIGYRLLCYGSIRFCPMCARDLRGA